MPANYTQFFPLLPSIPLTLVLPRYRYTFLLSPCLIYMVLMVHVFASTLHWTRIHPC